MLCRSKTITASCSRISNTCRIVVVAPPHVTRINRFRSDSLKIPRGKPDAPSSKRAKPLHPDLQVILSALPVPMRSRCVTSTRYSLPSESTDNAARVSGAAPLGNRCWDAVTD